jgi:hypothetical protein
MPPPAVSAPPAGSRDALVALARSGRPRAFLAAAMGSSFAQSGDAGVTFLIAASLARLGLKNIARARLALLPPEAAAAPEVVELRRAIDTLPSELVPGPVAQATLADNLRALRVAGVELGGLENASAGEVGRTLDGSPVVEHGGTLVGLSMAREEYGPAIAKMLAGQQPCPPPLVVSGFGTPTLLREVWQQSRDCVGGYAPRLHVIEEDAHFALGGLSCEGLANIIGDARVSWWLGANARKRFEAWCRARVDEMLPAAALPSEGRQGPGDVATHRVLEELKSTQAKELARLRSEVDPAYNVRDAGWWRSRYGSSRSLRVLVLSCRHTTYVRHAASDLADALRALGHEVRLLEEPDSHTRLTALSYARAVGEHKPDLLVGVNFARSSFGGAVPANVPFVCWIQDAMAHLFDPKQGAAHGEMDFVIGHTFNELFEKFGYPISRAMNCAVVASDRKFHPGPVAPELRDRFACEVAMVSHHSESPEALHARLAKMFGTIPNAGALVNAMLPLVKDAASKAGVQPLTTALRGAVATAGRLVLGRDLDERTATQMLRQYAQPVADRFFRHETLVWAAAICERRGWRMHLYGKGWEAHPELGGFAKGELAHGEELRAAYQCAGAQLHCSATAIVHQRVMECALSGGLCVCRFIRDGISGPRTSARVALLSRTPDAVNEERNEVGYRVVDHPEAMRLISLWQRLGEPHDGEFIWINRDRAALLMSSLPWLGNDHDADRLLGDLSLLTFRDQASLEHLLSRSIETPRWRESASNLVSGNVRRAFTHRTVGERMIELVRRGVTGTSGERLP